MRKTLIAVMLIAAAALPAAALAGARTPHHRAGPPPLGKASGEHPDYAPGELIVKFKPGVTAEKRADVLRDRRAGLKRSLPVARTQLVRIADGTDVESAIKAFERDPRVERAEPNVYMQGAAASNDPFLWEQWALNNTGQEVDELAGTPDADIDAPEAWQRTTGSRDVKVAIVDSGVTFGHPDLAPNIWHNPGETGSGRESNGVDDDGNGFVDDWRGWDFAGADNDPTDNYGHGTHVAGVAAANGNDGVGVTGVAWRASIVPVRVLDNTNGGYCAEITAGMAYAVRAGARVVNVSIGDPDPCATQRELIEATPNTLFVVSAMNEGTDNDAKPYYPCSFPSPNIVCVGATYQDDTLADFSNYGAQSVDLAAPGDNLLSAFPKWGSTQEVFSDGFETAVAGRWSAGGNPNTWGRTPLVETHSGAWAVSNSATGSYGNNTDNWFKLTLDLRNRSSCGASAWVKAALGSYDPGQPHESQDRLEIQVSSDGATWNRTEFRFIGTYAWQQRLIDLSLLEGRQSGAVRFRLASNGSDTYAGIALDDVRVYCVPPLTNYSGADDEYYFNYGTSMAAPHVAGVAVLLLSIDPSLTAAAVKQRILDNVDPLPSLAGKTVTGGRLNAARAVQSLPIPTADDTPAGGQNPAGPRTATGRKEAATTLAAGLKSLAKSLASGRIRGLLRRGAIAARLRVPAAGRLTLKLKSGAQTLASGGCTAKRAGRCPVTAKLTRRGRTLLRRARRMKLTLELAFKPRSGAAVKSRTTVTVGR